MLFLLMDPNTQCSPFLFHEVLMLPTSKLSSCSSRMGRPLRFNCSRSCLENRKDLALSEASSLTLSTLPVKYIFLCLSMLVALFVWIGTPFTIYAVIIVLVVGTV